MNYFALLLLLPCLARPVSGDAGINTEPTPYTIHMRPLPAGNDFNKLLPSRLGSYNRVSFKPPQPGLDGEALYRDGQKEVFMLFSLADTREDVKETMETILEEIKKEKTSEPKQISLKTSPAYIKFIGPTIAFFAWTREKYCFSVDAKGGNKLVLDEFMKLFPY